LEQLTDAELEAQMEIDYAASMELTERGLIVDDTGAAVLDHPEVTEEYLAYLDRRAAIAGRILAKRRAARLKHAAT
jgi:hypothetical protein